MVCIYFDRGGEGEEKEERGKKGEEKGEGKEKGEEEKAGEVLRKGKENKGEDKEESRGGGGEDKDNIFREGLFILRLWLFVLRQSGAVWLRCGW